MSARWSTIADMAGDEQLWVEGKPYTRAALERYRQLLRVERRDLSQRAATLTGEERVRKMAVRSHLRLLAQALASPADATASAAETSGAQGAKRTAVPGNRPGPNKPAGKGRGKAAGNSKATRGRKKTKQRESFTESYGSTGLSRSRSLRDTYRGPGVSSVVSGGAPGLGKRR